MSKAIEPEVVGHERKPKRGITTKFELATIPLMKLALLVVVTVISYIVPDFLPFIDEILLTVVTGLELRDIKNRILKK